MLNLTSRTDPGWVETALSDLDELLLDHAHCERKVAGLALRRMFRYPDQSFLHDPLSRLARLLELSEHEAEIIADPSPMVRMHT